MFMDDSAKTLAARMVRGELSATEVLHSCLRRIDQHNPGINALVTLDQAGALRAAQQADALVGNGDASRPLHAVPITIKDSFETAGLLTTSSHPPLRHYVPSADATAVARLRAAGAIIVGKTNLPELAGDPQCRSPLFGVTNNPWDLTRTSGGSSGGSAAAVAMGFSWLDLGSDIGGSIRIPAAYCGVVGFKATENRIPRTGHIPHLPGAPRSVRHLLSFGLLGRNVGDLRLGLDTVAGPDGLDIEVPLIVPASVKALERPLRVAYWDDFAGLPLCSRTRTALAQTVARLQEQGVEVQRCCPPGFDIEQAWYAYGIIAGAEIGLGMPALERYLLHGAGKLLPRSQVLARHMSKGLVCNWPRYNEALNMREGLITQLEQFLDSWDVWLCPVAPTTAYPHRPLSKYGKPPTILVDEQPLAYFDGTISLTSPFSLTGSPVVSLPVAVVEGLPVGLQLIGKRWCDEALLACCERIEQLLGGYRRPPLLG
ncbi:MAG: amidase [Pseudomonas sp.]|uniref:amidase n=1 Tax=Pseudomonas sp. TaxID=306 RepID=UPI0027373CAE|nr:amidase [Pseudomonas sp.]MDP3846881.1 amidase [Pseudomonas sp.]